MRRVIPVSAAVIAFFVVLRARHDDRSTSRTRSDRSPGRQARDGASRVDTISQHRGGRAPPQPACAYDCAAMPEQTVLVVDDEEAIAEAVRARLESEGYRVVVAARRAPRRSSPHAEHRPDLVVLDLMLPGHGRARGLQGDPARRLDAGAHAHRAGPRRPTRSPGFAVGADDYLTKPFSLRELAARVQGDPPADGADPSSARPTGRSSGHGLDDRPGPPPRRRSTARRSASRRSSSRSC